VRAGVSYTYDDCIFHPGHIFFSADEARARSHTRSLVGTALAAAALPRGASASRAAAALHTSSAAPRAA
jgi:hypothetical protein